MKSECSPFFTEVLYEINNKVEELLKSWNIVLLERSLLTVISYFWTLWIDVSDIIKLIWNIIRPDEVIILNCSFEERQKRLLQRPELSDNDKEIIYDEKRQKKINWCYYKTVKWFWWDFKSLDTTNLTIDETLFKILELLGK